MFKSPLNISSSIFTLFISASKNYFSAYQSQPSKLKVSFLELQKKDLTKKALKGEKDIQRKGIGEDLKNDFLPLP